MLHNALAPLVLTLALAACAEGGFRSADCGTLEGRLAELGIDPAEVVSVEQQVDRGAEGTVLRRHAWAKLKSCDGHVVVQMDSSCGPRGSNAYTTGNCRLPAPRPA